MKGLSSELSCPHCGSKSFSLKEEDIFLCEHCGQTFNFDLDNLILSSENKGFCEDLKSEFNDEVKKLYQEKAKCDKLLQYYSKKANKRTISTIVLILTIAFPIVMFMIESILSGMDIIFSIRLAVGLGVGGTIGLISLYMVCLKIERKIYSKYSVYASYYASIVADKEDLIRYYTGLVSKLTK